ncbi:hypothetical protein [Bosea sp. TAF32]|uniref:hypothetical protein n=1 Tax=Bosea sp. TAF32 TaxID=3237482 RepID=UPI003F8EE10E
MRLKKFWCRAAPILLMSSFAVGEAAAQQSPPHVVELHDRQAFAKGPWLAWLEPWGAGALIQGKDYTNAMKILPDRFPAETSIEWAWPSTPPASGVFNFLAINFGNYYNTKPPVPISARKVRDIAVLKHNHDFALAGNLDQYNVMTNIWLTREAGRHDQQLFEVQVFFHAADLAKLYVRSSTPIGAYRDETGRNWQVSIDRTRQVPDILLLPSTDVRISSVDIRAMLLWLRAQGVITGEEWFNGLGTGVEVTRGSGSMKINALSITYE